MSQTQTYENNKNRDFSMMDSPVQLGLSLNITQFSAKQSYLQSDEQFIDEIKAIYEKRKATMKSFFEETQISNEQCDEIGEYATIHSEANVFNSNSILSFKQIKKNPQIVYCSCGCKKAVGQHLPLLTNQQKLTFLGPGVILLFFFLRYTKTLVIFMLVSYGVFSIFSNILSPDNIQFVGCQEKTNDLQKYICYLNSISAFNLKSSSLLRNLQLWIGFFATLFWFFGAKIIQLLGEKKDKEIDDLLDSASDYTIRIQNLPFGQVNENQLIEYLEELWGCRHENRFEESSNQEIISSGNDKLNLRSIQIIYNMSECRSIIRKIQNLSLQIYSLLNDGKYVSPQNIAEYLQKKQKFIESFQEIQTFRENFKNDDKFRKGLSTTCALVYFHESEKQSEFVRYFQKKNRMNPLTQICEQEKEYFYKGNEINFTRAPEPSDFHWPNCEIRFSLFRYFFIWIITIIILYAAYAFVSYIQTIDQVKNQAQLLISVIIQIFNRIIWYSLSFLVIFQYNNTKTDEIVSLMKKSIFAQVINVIVAPMIGKFLNNKPIYGSNSVSLNALFYQFVMFFMMVIFYVINPLYYLKLIIINIKYLRNKMMRKLCEVVGEIDTIDQIRPVCVFYEGPPFPIAGAYVYMTTAIIHTLFYCHLQPIILIVLIGNMTGFHLIMKYLLFRRCKIPELTDRQIFEIGIGSISYGTFFYSAGSLIFIILEKYDENKLDQLDPLELIPSSISLVIWIILNINPFSITDKIVHWIYKLFQFHTYFQSQQQTQAQKKQYAMKILTQLVSNTLEKMGEKDAIVCERKQSYYKYSNAHKLFNFQSEIKEIADEDTVKRTHELQRFCEGFCRKQSIKIEEFYPPSVQTTMKQQTRNSRIQEELAEMILIPAIQLKKNTANKLNDSKPEQSQSKFVESQKNRSSNSTSKNERPSFLMESIFKRLAFGLQERKDTPTKIQEITKVNEQKKSSEEEIKSVSLQNQKNKQ